MGVLVVTQSVFEGFTGGVCKEYRVYLRKKAIGEDWGELCRLKLVDT